MTLVSHGIGIRTGLTLGLSTIHYIIGSLFFDIVHWKIHQKSRSKVFRWLSRAHSAHHQYFGCRLKFNERFRYANLTSHVPLEFFCQATGSCMSWLILRNLCETVAYDMQLVMVVLIIRTSVVVWNTGDDSNHIPYPTLPKDPYSLIVGPQYHALHHIDPQNYFGSMVRVIDTVLGTASTLKGRRVAMTGSSGALGRALTKTLQAEQVASITALRHGIEWSCEDILALAPVFAETDILVLSHGTKEAESASQVNCAAAIAMIELFKKERKRDTPELIPEVWYIGSEAEVHGCWSADKNMQAYSDSKRAFVPFARGYYDDAQILYRHIVPAAFKSSMGPGLVGANWAAKVAVWWIRRGAQYVPVTYTGFAFLNYFWFIYFVQPAKGRVIAENVALYDIIVRIIAGRSR